MESGVDFVAADMPMANKFTLHILAAVAEYESKLISQRIKAALAVAKTQGKKRGGPQRPDFKTYFVGGTEASAMAARERASKRANDMKAILCDLRDAGETVFGIARRLTEAGIVPPNGGPQWSPMTVKRMFEILGEPRPRPYHPNYVSKRRRGGLQRGASRALPVSGPLPKHGPVEIDEPRRYRLSGPIDTRHLREGGRDASGADFALLDDVQPRPVRGAEELQSIEEQHSLLLEEALQFEHDQFVAGNVRHRAARRGRRFRMFFRRRGKVGV